MPEPTLVQVAIEAALNEWHEQEDRSGSSREFAIVRTKLEEAFMWATVTNEIGPVPR